MSSSQQQQQQQQQSLLINTTTTHHPPPHGKQRHLESRVILSSGPLTIREIITSKGEKVYRFETRSKRYARVPDLITLGHQINKLTTSRVKLQQKWARYRRIHKAELREYQREYYRKRKMSSTIIISHNKEEEL